MGDATQTCGAIGLGELEFFYGENGAEDFMIKRDVLQAIVAKESFDFAEEGGVPSGIGAGRRGEQEAAVFAVFFDVGAFFFREGEVTLAGHDDEGNFEKFIVGELYGLESALGSDGGFLLHGGEEFIAEALGSMGASVDEIAALDGTFFREGGAEEKGEAEGCGVL